MTPLSGIISTDAARADHSDKGLKGGALNLLSSTVVGVASTAPAYSLAATLGFVVIIGVRSPIVTILAFIPMLLISMDTKSSTGPTPIAGQHSRGPRGRSRQASDGWADGVLSPLTFWSCPALLRWLGNMCSCSSGPPVLVLRRTMCWLVVGSSDRGDDRYLLRRYRNIRQFPKGIARSRADHAPASVDRGPGQSSEWHRASGASRPPVVPFNPFVGSFSAFVAGLTLMLFIYWGWDTSVSVNEETANKHVTPGRVRCSRP